jgi:hypothetical protein
LAPTILGIHILAQMYCVLAPNYNDYILVNTYSQMESFGCAQQKVSTTFFSFSKKRSLYPLGSDVEKY